MKNLILIIAVLVVGACGKGKEAQTKTKVTKPVKVLTAEEQKVVGEYEIKLGVNTLRLVLLKNGIAEGYTNGKKDERDSKWELKDGEIHLTADGITGIWRINKDGSITIIARIGKDGERGDLANEKEDEATLKRIK